jgi:adenylate kinase family enzyme
VLGAGGAGKTTLAVALGRLLDLPVIHLDRHYWKAGWVAPTREEWHGTVRELSARDAWVMDGNYSSTLAARLERAHVAVLLDPSLWTCISGIYRRGLARGVDRPDLADGCEDRLPDREFLWYVTTYKYRSRPRVLRLIGAAGHVRLRHLRSRGQANDLLEEIRASGGGGLGGSGRLG